MLQSMVSQRVRHDSSDLAHTHNIQITYLRGKIHRGDLGFYEADHSG